MHHGLLRKVAGIVVVWAGLIALGTSGGCGTDTNCGAPTQIWTAYNTDGGEITLCCPPSGENAGCACIEAENGKCPADAGQL